MSEPTPAAYRELTDQVYDLYGEERYDEALAVAESGFSRHPDRLADLAYAAACLLAVSGRPDQALDRLLDAERQGAWWHRRLLAEDDDLAGLRALDGFAELVDRSHALAEQAQAEVVAPLVAEPPGPARGVLIVLHGADEAAADAFGQWRSATDDGFVLVAMESSQRNTPMSRSWPDPEVADRDIAHAYAGLTATQQALPLVVGGFSAGARHAIRWALNGTPGSPAGFIAHAPAVDPGRLPDPVAAVARGCIGVILLGDSDDEVGPDAVASYEFLAGAGLTIRLERIEGLGHAFGIDFPARLGQALDEVASTWSGRAGSGSSG